MSTWSLALRNLAHFRARTAVGTAGVAFAVILVLVQLAFLGATRDTATQIYDQLQFDLLVRSPDYVHLCDARSFPRERLVQAAASPEVLRAVGVLVGLREWRSPITGQNRAILTLGVDPALPTFRDPAIQRQAPRLAAPGAVLVDRRSRPEYGPRDGRRFGDADLGTETTLGNRVVRIAGHYALGAGFAANGSVLIKDREFCRCEPYQPWRRVQLGLLQLRDPTRADAARRALAARLAPLGDAVVLTRQEARRREIDRWVRETSLGIMFQMGAAVAVMVGVSIVYQVLAAGVANLLREYATLKAIGYPGGVLARVIVQQALVLAAIGFVLGWALTEALLRWLAAQAGVAMSTPAARAAGVALLALAMCAVSGLLAARKLRSADPADLF